MSPRVGTTAGRIVVCLLELAVGILLLVDPMGFTSGIIIAVGIALLLNGVVCIVRYFQTPPEQAATQTMLAQGLLSVTVGLFCVTKSEWFLVTFQMLTILYAVAVLVTGFYKVQTAVDLLRRNVKDWQWTAISAVLSLVLALVILWNPFTSSVVLWQFIAVYLIAEAVFDMVTLIRSHKTVTL